ncbi:MAG: hypothetical protein KF760_27785 [Candidatus Eremiobacteraeota bacterium]|nr:hypothetical protein [Candidatus Eremiobacteraeota bacterium]MCW5872615.1 hypothetical protein [Candidatus Eremiobacteraeota bacterium]
MAKGLPGSTLGQGSFFEVLEERIVKLRPEEMNGRYAVAEARPAPVAFRRRPARRLPIGPVLSKAL